MVQSALLRPLLPNKPADEAGRTFQRWRDGTLAAVAMFLAAVFLCLACSHLGSPAVSPSIEKILTLPELNIHIKPVWRNIHKREGGVYNGGAQEARKWDT